VTRPRSVTTPIDAFAAVLADFQGRLQQVELQAHRHNTPAAALLPAGSIVETLWTTDPTGFLLLDGRTIPNGATAYPALWAVAVVWQSGTDLILPTDVGKMVRAF
jgi:hypothetical protein